MVLGMGLASIS